MIGDVLTTKYYWQQFYATLPYLPEDYEPELTTREKLLKILGKLPIYE